jgi:hypothetical protein
VVRESELRHPYIVSKHPPLGKLFPRVRISDSEVSVESVGCSLLSADDEAHGVNEGFLRFLSCPFHYFLIVSFFCQRVSPCRLTAVMFCVREGPLRPRYLSAA